MDQPRACDWHSSPSWQAPESRDSSSSFDDDDLSVLEYARKYDLSKSIFDTRPTSRLPAMLIPVMSNDGYLAFPDEDDFVQAADLDLREKQEFSKPARQLLYETCVVPPPTPFWDPETIDPALVDQRRLRDLRLEELVLETDAELDFIALKCATRWPRLPDPSCIDLVPIPVDVEKDDGLEFPTWVADLPDRIARQVEDEKLQITIDAATILYEVVNDQATREDAEASVQWAISLLKKMPEPLTPILSPLTLPRPHSSFATHHPLEELRFEDLPTMPELSELDVAMTSNPIDDDRIAGQSNDDTSSLDTFQQPFQIDPQPSVMPQELTVDVPLMPRDDIADDEANSEKKSFGQVITEEVHNELRKCIAEMVSNIRNLPDERRHFIESRQQANRAIEQEQLTVDDSGLRVKVPFVIDHHSANDLPFTNDPLLVVDRPRGNLILFDVGCQHSPEGVAQLRKTEKAKQIFKKLAEKPNLIVDLAADTDEYGVPWPPSTHRDIALDMMNELRYLLKINDDKSTKDALHSSELLEPNSTRIPGDSKDDDDQVLPAVFPEDEQNVEFAIKRRRLEAEMKNSATDHSGKTNSTSKTPPSYGFFHNVGPHGFKPKEKLASLFSDEVIDYIEQQLFPEPSAAQSQGVHPTGPKPYEMTLRMECVNVPADLQERQFIVTTKFLQTRRNLVKVIKQLYPSAEFIERDPSALKPEGLNYMPPKPQDPRLREFERVHEPYDPRIEAEIMLSPSTGLILTNYINTIQKSLPGSGPVVNTFHQHLKQVAYRYERLIVLVSPGSLEKSSTTSLSRFGLESTLFGPHSRDSFEAEGNQIPAQDYGRQMQALTELRTVANATEADVHIKFVPGGETELAIMAVVCMKKFGTNDFLLPEESTCEEELLCRLGFNAYAALAVLQMLPNDPHDDILGRDGASWDSTDEARRHGLSHGLFVFLNMPDHDRISNFRCLMLGQKRVLERVNKSVANINKVPGGF